MYTVPVSFASARRWMSDLRQSNPLRDVSNFSQGREARVFNIVAPCPRRARSLGLPALAEEDWLKKTG